MPPVPEQKPRRAGNIRKEASGDKRKDPTKGQMNRTAQRKKIKEIQREYVELITQMHESDITTKEWVTWLHFEVNMNTATMDHIIAQNNTGIDIMKELIAHIIDLKKMI